MNSKKEKNISIFIKLIAIIASIYGMIATYSGYEHLTYFTNLSNVFIDIMLGIFLVLTLKGKKPKNNFYRIKYLATISITLTFFVYMFVIGPNNPEGLIGSYLRDGGGNFCVHFITPVLSLIDYLLYDYEFESSKIDNLYDVIPPVLYVVSVFVASFLGMRWPDDMYAPYNFLNYHSKVGWFGFDLSQMSSTTFGIGVFYMIILLTVIFVIFGNILLKLKDFRKKHIKHQLHNKKIRGR